MFMFSSSDIASNNSTEMEGSGGGCKLCIYGLSFLWMQ